jgi:peptidoglycan/xylan/chitin deacetylase (PgdA/CDA1 family)
MPFTRNVRRRPARAALALLSVALISGCASGARESGTSEPVAAKPSPTLSAVAATMPAAPASKGPPPKKGTLAWYVYQLPAFAPPPAPLQVVTLPASGRAKQINRVDVGGQKVAFITIDDGWEKDPATITLLRAAQIPFTMFLTTDAIKSDTGFFKTLQGLGGVVEDHTITHPKLTTMSYAQQKREICGSAATLAKLYGRAPLIMRAPYGLSNANTRKAAASCGIKANVFWDEYAITGSVTWQRPGGILPGDMVLMHFDKYFKANFVAALTAFKKNGITPALLESYLVTSPPTPIVPATPSTAPGSPAAVP